MTPFSKDLVPLGQVRARLAELVEEARAGSDKHITTDGEA